MAFVTELWESVFQPGTTPALILATHISFGLLIASLCAMIYLSRSIHFVNLLIIALCLWGSVTWFISELKSEKAKLLSNEELAKEGGNGADADANSGEKVEKNDEVKKER